MARSVPVPSHNNIPPAAGPAVSPARSTGAAARPEIRPARRTGGTKHSPPPHLPKKPFWGGQALPQQAVEEILRHARQRPVQHHPQGCALPQGGAPQIGPGPALRRVHGLFQRQEGMPLLRRKFAQASQRTQRSVRAGLQQRHAHGAHRAAGILQKVHGQQEQTPLLRRGRGPHPHRRSVGRCGAQFFQHVPVALRLSLIHI